MKHFSILAIGFVLMTSVNLVFAQSPAAQQAEQNQTEQSSRGKAQRQHRQGKNRGAKMRQRLAQLDVDKDQKISRDEWKRRPRAFNRLDTDGDGFITREEITALREQRRKRNNPNATKPPAN